MSLYFPNRFPNYSSEAAEGILVTTSEGVKISSEYKTKLLEAIAEHQNVIKHSTKEWRNSSDLSVYTGVAGYAVVHLHCFQKLKDDNALKQAEEKVLHLIQNEGSKSRLTYLCGVAGQLVCAAIMAETAGSQRHLREPKHYVERLVALSDRAVQGTDGLPDELLYGRTGYLFSLLLLDRLQICSSLVRPVVPRVVAAILESGQKMAAEQRLTSPPLMFEWHNKKYYGAAHGLVGILVVLLQAVEHLPPNALEELIQPTVDYLQQQLFSSGNLPSSEGSRNGDRLVQWCHGAPGAAIFFAMAHKVLGGSKYLESARRCADVVWERGLLTKGYSLCHGAAGNAYSFLYMYQVTKEPEYLYKACQFGSWCQQYGQHGCSIPDRPFSLFEGMAGSLHFLVDLMDVDKAAFPGLVLPVID